LCGAGWWGANIAFAQTPVASSRLERRKLDRLRLAGPSALVLLYESLFFLLGKCFCSLSAHLSM